MRWLLLGLVSAGMAVHAAAGQASNTNIPSYVDENGKDPAPITLDGLTGRVQGLGRDPMPRVTVALFTEEGHTLVGAETSDRDGKFKFLKVEHGLYRVVVKVEGLCPANVPIRVEGSPLAHHKLIITMRPKDIDTCSYGMGKR